MQDMGKRRRSGPPKTAAEVREDGRTTASSDRPARPTRRVYTAEYKQRVLEELAELKVSGDPGAAGALLRREGLYWGTIHRWRQELQRAQKAALEPRKRGRKPTRDATTEEMARLRRENERLQEKLRQAEIIIDVQKKLSVLLGVELPKVPEEES